MAGVPEGVTELLAVTLGEGVPLGVGDGKITSELLGVGAG
jgi:hypothetical protein